MRTQSRHFMNWDKSRELAEIKYLLRFFTNTSFSSPLREPAKHNSQFCFVFISSLAPCFLLFFCGPKLLSSRLSRDALFLNFFSRDQLDWVFVKAFRATNRFKIRPKTECESWAREIARQAVSFLWLRDACRGGRVSACVCKSILSVSRVIIGYREKTRHRAYRAIASA